MAEKLSVEINFSRERLKVLIENLDASTKANMFGVEKQFVEYLDKKCELTQEAIFKNADCLKNDEKELILLFFKTLGRSDVENQTKEIQTFISRFQDVKKVCDEEQKKYGKLSVKLGIVAGLFFVVVLI